MKNHGLTAAMYVLLSPETELSPLMYVWSVEKAPMVEFSADWIWPPNVAEPRSDVRP